MVSRKNLVKCLGRFGQVGWVCYAELVMGARTVRLHVIAVWRGRLGLGTMRACTKNVVFLKFVSWKAVEGIRLSGGLTASLPCTGRPATLAVFSSDALTAFRGLDTVIGIGGSLDWYVTA